MKALADQVASRGLVIGSLVATVWGPTGGGSAMGSEEERKAFLTQVRKSCGIAKKLKDIGIRHYGIVRVDSSCSPADWAEDPAGNTKKIADTFRESCNIAESYGERLAAEGEICWGGMHSWKYLHELLEQVGRPETLGIHLADRHCCGRREYDRVHHRARLGHRVPGRAGHQDRVELAYCRRNGRQH